MKDHENTRSKIFIAVENQVYPDILRSLFRLLKLSIKVIATSPKSLRLGKKKTNLIILDYTPSSELSQPAE